MVVKLLQPKVSWVVATPNTGATNMKCLRHKKLFLKGYPMFQKHPIAFSFSESHQNPAKILKSPYQS